MDVWHIRREKVRNEVVQNKVGMTSIIDKMKEARLRWFRYVKRRYTDTPVRKCERLAIVGIRRGKDKIEEVLGRLLKTPIEEMKYHELQQFEELLDAAVEKLVQALAKLQKECGGVFPYEIIGSDLTPPEDK
ncbi:hypothetical protein H5410_053813 [Solanum commersonii]|uniref:Uncharacterized protein n=1 Tax=Solanum commersonii TaxID=4109 RepID=A0A9J5X5L5_SOLCO|nr:hypothetical protein H5410_053813 [Solanum commersonii]